MELGVQVKTPEELPRKLDCHYITQNGTLRRRQRRKPTVALELHHRLREVQITLTPSKMYNPHYGQRHHPKKGHARYNIFAYGCSPTVYRGIDAAHKALYALLLSSRDFLGEHPRKDTQTLKAVRRMKPFWNGGEDCYHWVEHNDVLHGPVPLRREGLLVGNQM